MVLTGWCLALSEDLPFLPMVDVLRALRKHDDGRLLDAAFAACPAYVRREIAKLLPEVDDGTEPPVAGDALSRQRLFGAVAMLLVAVRDSTPFALSFEDVHWADTSTKDLIAYLLTPTHATNVPIVMTSRTDERQEGWLQQLNRQGRLDWLTLGPLTRAGTAEQIGALGRPATRTYVLAVFARSQGNPLFTEHIVCSSARQDELPASIQAVVRALV
jgi:AAA ATPase domain